MCHLGSAQIYGTRTIDLCRGEWGELWPFLRWREEQAPPLRPKSQPVPIISREPFQISDGFVDMVSAAEIQHEDNRFTQRRMGTAAAVLTLAGTASGAPTVENRNAWRPYS
jgi:hypothetical protein